MYKAPMISNNRCFISPILGCDGHCSYCYLMGNSIPQVNLFGINNTVDYLANNPEFISGRQGTILSLGAWGDLFPHDSAMRTYSIEWIKQLLLLENPMQIMSKNKLTSSEIHEIVSSVQYVNQLLYSTTITTLQYSSIIESNADSPEERFQTLSAVRKVGIPTNIMIKPFIPHITYSDSLIEAIVDVHPLYCVVGKLYVNDNIMNVMMKSDLLFDAVSSADFHLHGQISCVENADLLTYEEFEIDTFIRELQKNHIRVFKKSSCVTANLLGNKNRSFSRYTASGVCMNCGNCH